MILYHWSGILRERTSVLTLKGGEKMNGKMKSCFTPHVLMHSLFGFGLALVLIHFIPVLNSVVLGVVLMVLALIADSMRK